MRQWLEEVLVPLARKSDTAAAIHYVLARWDALARYLDDDRIEPTTRPPKEPCVPSPWEDGTI